MAPKPDLRLSEPITLSEPEEESDIGEFTSIASGSTILTNRTTASRSTGGPSPVVVFTQSSHRQIETLSPARTSFSSPSSPDLSKLKVDRPRGLSRSHTLPRLFQNEQNSRRKSSDIDGLVVDPEVVAKIRRWILGITIVDFDIDVGPVISGVYPPMILLPAESENIAFASLPDSLHADQGSQVHSFRIRESPTSLANEKRPASQDGFIYGYSYFTQRKDATIKRGYQQRSVVILTHHQYPALFTHLSMVFGPLYEAHGIPMLEAACHNIANWSDPTPGSTLELGFLGSVLLVEIPHTNDEQQLTETSSFREKYNPRLHILASSPPLIPPPLLLFEACFPNLWSIWECLVLCEPMLVFGHSPTMTSQAIWWFRDLLRPIPLANDIRPYFTIHDQDHALLVNKLPPKSGILLGVTNPFFESECAHWPNVLSLGRHKHSTKNSVGTAGPTPGWKSKKHKRYISKDRPLLKQLEDACGGSEQTQIDASLILRRHFCSRTNELLVPLSRYLNSLIPPPAEINGPTKHRPRLKPFQSQSFMASLKAHGSPLPFRSTSKKMEFYERWIKTPSFHLWLAREEAIVEAIVVQKRQC